ncbi:hypothetical protein EV175_000376 [Coemansia sp. RSA 1933]|nr:hypothetical protein EV175_000376 [Coemansia sp. RSA 1933]
MEVDEEEEIDHTILSKVPRTSEQRAIIQRRVSQLTKAQERRRVLWTGPPDLVDLDHNASLPARNMNCIDLAIDETVWRKMREARLDAADIVVESDPAKVREYIGGLSLKGPEDDPSASTAAAPPLALVLSNEKPSYIGVGNSGKAVDIEPLSAIPYLEMPGNRGWMANNMQSALTIDWAPQRHKTGPKNIGTICTDYIAVGGLDVGSEGIASMNQVYLERDRQPKPGAIQIWALRTDPMSKQTTPEESCKLDMLVLHRFGRCIKLKWCPISIAHHNEPTDGKIRIIGYLAAIFGDGYLRVCAVPVPDQLRKDADPRTAVLSMQWPQTSLLHVRAPRGIFTSIDWACADLIAAATSKGTLIVWPLRVGASTTSSTSTSTSTSTTAVIPIFNQTVHTGPISSVHALCMAFGGPSSSYSTDNDQTDKFTKISTAHVQMFSIGSDGRLQKILLGLPMRQRYPLMRFPGRLYASAKYWKTQSFLISDAVNNMRVFAEPAMIRMGDPVGCSLATHYLHSTETTSSESERHAAGQWNSDIDLNIVNCFHSDGTMLQVATSEFHPFAAMVAASGQVAIQNIECTKDSRRASIMHRIVYELAWDDGAERLVCYRGRPLMHVPTKRGASINQFALFPPQVSVQACAWSRNPLSSAWMASAGAGGLLRIENVSTMPSCI